MRLVFPMAVALGLALLLAPAAPAQQFMPGPGTLLTNGGVQKELKMDKDQVEKVTQAVTKFRDDHKDELDKVRDPNLSREERAEVMKKVSEASQKMLADVLKPEQRKRLRQIQLQQQGIIAFADPEVLKALNLTDEQKEKLKAVNDEARQKMQDIFQKAAGDRQEAMKQMAELRKENLASAMKILTDEQKKSWKELTGEPFEVKYEFNRP
jgi:hypothetical protein